MRKNNTIIGVILMAIPVLILIIALGVTIGWATTLTIAGFIFFLAMFFTGFSIWFYWFLNK